jgi:hypothetical protein
VRPLSLADAREQQRCSAKHADPNDPGSNRQLLFGVYVQSANAQDIAASSEAVASKEYESARDDQDAAGNGAKSQTTSMR